jgi:DNA-binding response OmpR family regulator
VDVEVVRWPADRARVDELRARGLPRLLRVAAGTPAPAGADCLEDWVAHDAGEAEVAARRAAVLARAARHGARPALDEHGVLRHRDGWVPLSPVERSLASVLVDCFGTVVRRETLARRAWPDGLPTRNALDVLVLRLRRRIAPLGLAIRTVRARGYLLEAAPHGH